MSKSCPVVHFEMPYEQRERMASFYQNAFGWQMQMLGEQMGNYVLATTTEMNGHFPKQAGRINGGFFQKARLAGPASVRRHCRRRHSDGDERGEEGGRRSAG